MIKRGKRWKPKMAIKSLLREHLLLMEHHLQKEHHPQKSHLISRKKRPSHKKLTRKDPFLKNLRIKMNKLRARLHLKSKKKLQKLLNHSCR